jgi:hypothetical protein
MVLDRLWARFRGAAPGEIDAALERQLRLAFYSGAQSMLNLTLENAAKTDEILEPKMLDFFTEIQDEFVAFGETLFEDDS